METIQTCPITGRDCYTPKKAKAPHPHGALSEVKKQKNYTLSAATKTLRPHQQEASEAVFSRLEAGISRQLIEAATGTGKTFIAVHIAGCIDGQVLFLVHREELLHQTIRAFQDVGYSLEDIGVIWQGRQEISKRFVVGMVQTVHARLSIIPSVQFECLIFDEAHHATAKSWRTVAEHFTPKLRLGLSATPERADGAPLNDLFDEVTYSLGIRKAIEQGLLVKPMAIQTRTELNLERVKVRCGDFADGELQAALDTDERNQLIVQKWTEHAANRKTLVFAAGIAHSESLAATFQSQGIAADYVYGNDPQRAEKLKAFSFGEIQVLTNAMVLTEGFDEPSASAIVFARPTKSRPLYAQMLGRGLRLFPGKEDCTVLDFVDNTGRHSIITAWNFFGHQKPPGGELRDCSQPVEIVPTQGKGAALRLKDVTVVDRIVDLLQPPPKVNPLSMGSAAWHQQPASTKQLILLADHGIDASGWSKGQAHAAINQLPISDKQRAALLARGFNVLTKSWTRGMVDAAFLAAEQQGVMQDWSLVRRAGL
jgi:superfamily II DNA or RNA helicase